MCVVRLGLCKVKKKMKTSKLSVVLAVWLVAIEEGVVSEGKMKVAGEGSVLGLDGDAS